MSRGAKTGKPISGSAKVLAANTTPLIDASRKLRETREILDKLIPASTQRTITKAIKSTTLRTLDDLAGFLDLPAWMLIHPDMQKWHEHRLWINHIIRAYLEADENGRDLFRSVARTVDKKHTAPAEAKR